MCTCLCEQVSYYNTHIKTEHIKTIQKQVCKVARLGQFLIIAHTVYEIENCGVCLLANLYIIVSY